MSEPQKPIGAEACELIVFQIGGQEFSPLVDGETAFSEGLNLDITDSYVNELRLRLSN